MKKRTEITIETSRRVIVRSSSNWREKWCEQCRGVVRMISPNEAAARLNVSSRLIYRWIEEGSIHFREEPGGLMVCETSLPPTTGRLLT
jgi:excisionase family DNA binding protein